MTDRFRIYPEVPNFTIERMVYPRFVGEITFGEFAVVENITMLDKCTNVSLLAKCLKETNEYVYSFMGITEYTIKELIENN